MTFYEAVDVDYLNKAFANAIKKEFDTVTNHRANGPTGRVFRLMRNKDESDVSGTGHVATGHVWSDGSVTLKWHTNNSSAASINHYPSVDNMLSIHGHLSKKWPYGYTTRVEYVGDEQPVGAKLLKELSDFSYELGTVAERLEKGVPADVSYIKAAYGRILDLAQDAA